MTDDGYRLLGNLPSGNEGATTFLRFPAVEGAVGYEVYRGRSYELPDFASERGSGGPRRVPAAELVEAIRERIEDACTCDEALKEALLAVVGRHAPEPVGTYLGDKPPLICIECSYGRYDEVPSPCPELRDIGRELGIEVADA